MFATVKQQIYIRKSFLIINFYANKVEILSRSMKNYINQKVSIVQENTKINFFYWKLNEVYYNLIIIIMYYHILIFLIIKLHRNLVPCILVSSGNMLFFNELFLLISSCRYVESSCYFINLFKYVLCDAICHLQMQCHS